MRITSIKTSNFIGARDVDLTLSRPVTLVCGKNHSGKSSVAEGVRMALTGEPSRVSMKKDYRALVSDGAKVGYAVVEYGCHRSAITIPNGANEHTGGMPPVVPPCVLDAQRFSSLSDNERRSFLFELMGLRTDGESVSRRLLDKGVDPIKKGEIIPFLRSGFDVAHKEAQSKAREAKAAWRAITGETYGGTKAASWEATKPHTDANALLQARDDVARLDAQIEELAAEIAVMRADEDRHARESRTIAELRARASQYARIDAKLRKDEDELKEWQAKVEIEARKPNKRFPTEPTYTCPQCSAVLRHDHANGALVIFTPPPLVDRNEPDNLAEYQRARDLLARSVENDRRDLAIADAAAKQLAEIEGEKSSPAPAPEEIEAARQKLTDLRNQKTRAAADLKVLEESERLAAQADKRTEAAAIHHADVWQWEAIADALAPNGIPGEVLAEALGPINARLASSAHMAEWATVVIGPDMGITAGGRPYSLLSESEKWRADAILAEAVSHLSGAKLLVLDRFDVLDMTGREDLLYWIDGLAEDGEIDTALLFGTLKALPSSLPDSVEAFWIDRGRAGAGKVLEEA